MTMVVRHAALVGVHAHVALRGGGGLAHLLIRLALWHWLWRLFWLVWRVPTFGPVIVFVVAAAVIAAAVLRRRSRRGRRGSAGYGSGARPRDW
jgi:hypothetical protein